MKSTLLTVEPTCNVDCLKYILLCSKTTDYLRRIHFFVAVFCAFIAWPASYGALGHMTPSLDFQHFTYGVRQAFATTGGNMVASDTGLEAFGLYIVSPQNADLVFFEQIGQKSTDFTWNPEEILRQ